MISTPPLDLQAACGSVARQFRRIVDSYNEYHVHAQFKIRAASLVGVTAFPIFYFQWTYLDPQPYENVVARAIGTLLCLLLIAMPNLPANFEKYKIALSYFTFIYCLPFFFTFMNGATPEWQLSTLSALVYTAFLFDTLNVFPAVLIGVASGVIAFFFISPSPTLPWELVKALPIYCFTLVALVSLNHSSDVITNEKMRAVHALAGYIAHEMRTPLSSIRFDAESIASLLNSPTAPNLRELAPTSTVVQCQPPFDQEKSALDRILRQTEAANFVIDTLLFNVRSPNNFDHNVTALDAKSTIQSALNQYSFKPGQRDRIDVDAASTFTFLGNDILMHHVLFNLLRNALRAASENNGRVQITCKREGRRNVIRVSDGGAGIAPEIIPQLFIPFRSVYWDNGGTGLGLAFCKDVISSAGGTISCNSRTGEGTDFIISLPPAPTESGLTQHLITDTT